ncbi:hypothetical protein ACH0BF_03900, partial [Pseudobacillus sp. 179-B 2D1 NHS]|uniref:hypothetical protein n=1 Tax=Pseudobacillus sp. 179-B 2D1 NHS TaxID=3374292 RepID=UPI003879E11B
ATQPGRHMTSSSKEAELDRIKAKPPVRGHLFSHRLPLRQAVYKDCFMCKENFSKQKETASFF